MSAVCHGTRWRVAGMLLVCIAGCSPAGSSTTITGRVIRKGMTVVLPLDRQGNGLEVTLVALSSEGRPGAGFQSDTDPQTGIFRVRGLPAKPLTPGRYRVAVTFPDGAQGPEADADFTLRSSPLIVDVPAGDIDLEVDLDTRQVRIR